MGWTESPWAGPKRNVHSLGGPLDAQVKSGPAHNPPSLIWVSNWPGPAHSHT